MTDFYLGPVLNAQCENKCSFVVCIFQIDLLPCLPFSFPCCQGDILGIYVSVPTGYFRDICFSNLYMLLWLNFLKLLDWEN